MSEPRPEEFFELGLFVAWHACGCDAKGGMSFLKRYLKAQNAPVDILRGALILHDSPADSRGRAEECIEELRKRGDETSKVYLERLEREGFETFVDTFFGSEKNNRRLIAKDKDLAKCLVKSRLAVWRSQGCARGMDKGLGYREVSRIEAWKRLPPKPIPRKPLDVPTIDAAAARGSRSLGRDETQARMMKD